MAEIKAPKLVASGQSTATTYHFRRDDRDFGWALCTVNDQTGELLITSDWGNWAHRWSADPNHLGHPTLTHFLGERGSCDYLANKLTLGEKHRRERFDQGKSVAALRRLLCERRIEAGRRTRPVNHRGNLLTRGLARELWDDIGDIDTDNAQIFCERFMQLDGYELITERPWEDLEHVPTVEYVVLRDGILPALVEACREQVNNRAQRERMGAGHA